MKVRSKRRFLNNMFCTDFVCTSLPVPDPCSIFHHLHVRGFFCLQMAAKPKSMVEAIILRAKKASLEPGLGALVVDERAVLSVARGQHRGSVPLQAGQLRAETNKKLWSIFFTYYPSCLLCYRFIGGEHLSDRPLPTLPRSFSPH